MLENLEHRGAVGSDKTVGDGAGMLTNIPDKLFREEFKKISIGFAKRKSLWCGNDLSSNLKKRVR